jgi:hypothetical protein
VVGTLAVCTVRVWKKSVYICIRVFDIRVVRIAVCTIENYCRVQDILIRQLDIIVCSWHATAND